MAACSLHPESQTSFTCGSCGQARCDACRVTAGKSILCRDCAKKLGLSVPSASPAPPKPSAAAAAQPPAQPRPPAPSARPVEAYVPPPARPWWVVPAGVVVVLGLAFLAWRSLSPTGAASEIALRERVVAYVETLKAGQFDHAYKTFWKTHPRPAPEIEALLALQWQTGAIVAHRIEQVRFSGGEATVAVSVTIRLWDDFNKEETEQIVARNWTWSRRDGVWYFHGDLTAPGT